MAQTDTPTATDADPTIENLDDEYLEALASCVEEQAEILSNQGWNPQNAIQGALDNVLDDRSYHVPETRTANREALERELRCRFLSLRSRATLWTTRHTCRFEPATVVEADETEAV